jgi:hypothetical protein
MRMVRCGLLVGVSLGMVAGGVAAGTVYNPFFPLLDDWQWTYEGSGYTLSASVAGEREVLGDTVIVVAVSITGPETASYESYWSVDDAGTVFLHGFDNPFIPAVRAYDPPIRYLPRSLVVGESWSTAHTRYGDLDGTDSLGVATVRYEVEAETVLDVPAGSFACFEVLGGDVKGGDRIPVDGYPGVLRGSGSDWFARDVGRVRRPGLATFDLTGYSGTVVPIRAITWTAIKRIFAE